MKIDKAPTTFIVSERGGGWPPNIGGHDRQLVAVLQERDEKLAALASRVTWVLGGLKLCGIDVARAYLVCNERSDEVAFAARVMVAGAILAAMRQAGGGRLVLAGDPTLSPALRPHLLDLTEALALDTQDPRVEVASVFHAPTDVPKNMLRRAGIARALN